MEYLRKEIINDFENIGYTNRGIHPLYTAEKGAKILIIGQAPGAKAEKAMIPFQDKSGERLMDWLGVEEKVFRDTDKFAILPMDFYYPGRGKSGDKPPRKGFAEKWHPRFLEEMRQVELTLLVGKYAIDYYLKGIKEKNLTETVKSYKNYLPKYFPLVHPSPLNFRWLNRNPWFEEEVVPELRKMVGRILNL